MNKSFLDIILNNPFAGQIRILFDLVVLLMNKIAGLLERIVFLIWDIFVIVFGGILQFTIDLIILILGYF